MAEDLNALLDLTFFNVLEKQETADDIRFTVEWDGIDYPCPYCGHVSPIYKHGVKPQVIMDLPIRGKRVGLTIQHQRFKCQYCGKTFMQHLIGVDERRAATRRLIEYIEKQSLRRTFTSIGYDVGVSEATVRSIFHDHVRKLDDTVHFTTPEWLGMDELKLMKKTRGMITNVKERTVIAMRPNRDKVHIKKYLTKLPDKERVQLVAMDMWDPYRQAVRDLLPWAQVVVDKFHVTSMATDGMDAVRKSIRAGLTDRQRRTLMHDRFILLHRNADLNQTQRTDRDAWFGAFPQLETAYWMKEAFCDLWDASTSREEAEEAYDTWAACLPDDLSWAFYDLTTAMTNWRDEIFAHFAFGHATNAYTEAVNGLAKLIARNGRGYSFEAVRAKVLYGNGLKMNARPKYNRNKDLDAFMSAVGGGVEVTHYDTLGNEISTLIADWKGSGS
jgi:transposase